MQPKFENYVRNGDLVLIYHSSTDKTDRNKSPSQHIQADVIPPEPVEQVFKKKFGSVDCTNLLSFACVLNTTTYFNSQ